MINPQWKQFYASLLALCTEPTNNFMSVTAGVTEFSGPLKSLQNKHREEESSLITFPEFTAGCLIKDTVPIQVFSQKAQFVAF